MSGHSQRCSSCSRSVDQFFSVTVTDTSNINVTSLSTLIIVAQCGFQTLEYKFRLSDGESNRICSHVYRETSMILLL